MEEASLASLFAGLNLVDEERARKRETFPSDTYAEHAARKLSSACLFDKLISQQLRPGISILRGSTLVRFPRRLMSNLYVQTRWLARDEHSHSPYVLFTIPHHPQMMSPFRALMHTAVRA